MKKTTSKKGSDSSLNEYYIFVGQFVTQFADVEFFLRRFLYVQSGLGIKKFNLLIGFPRTADLINKIKALAVDKPLSAGALEAVQTAFVQLDHIIRLRDKLLHYGLGPSRSGKILIRTKGNKLNATTGLPYEALENDDLNNASLDLRDIKRILIYHLDYLLPADFKEAKKQFIQKNYSWRYKPHEQRPKKK